MQRQDSLHDQLKTVVKLANAAGCYDAADFIQRVVDDTTRRMEAAGIEDVSLCKTGCYCATKTINGKCGKCGAEKP